MQSRADEGDPARRASTSRVAGPGRIHFRS
jgi:hypothetical protein